MAALSSSYRRNGSRVSSSGACDDLPCGSCNFRDLSLGARAPTCGCRRFWLNIATPSAPDGNGERAWCFCGHHACFHDATNRQKTEQDQGRALSAVPAADDEEHGQIVTKSQGVLERRSIRKYETPTRGPSGLGIQPDPRSQPASINTRVWQALNEFARDQEDGNASDTASKLPSTAPPSVADWDRLSPNRIIQDRLQLYRPMGPPVNIPHNTAITRPAEEYSATEVATPSIAGTPDFRAMASSSSPNRTSPGHIYPGHIQNTSNTRFSDAHKDVQTQQGQQHTLPEASPPLSTVENPPMSTRDMQTLLVTLGRRMEVVENLSFSTVPVEELQERFEFFDGRLLDLEQWRTDYEQNQASSDTSQQTNSKRRRLLPDEKMSFDSDGSFDLNAAAQTEAVVLATLAANSETHPRIDDLETRVADLESRTLPSCNRPWQIQVVLLPWGRELRGIWFSAEDASQHLARSATQLSEEWSLAQPAAPLSFKSSFSGTWTTESIEAWANEAKEWLSPKACGPTGMVFQRLASRGFVRDIEITAPDARHVLNSIRNAFESIIPTKNQPEAVDKQYQGLGEPFIPLRKIRKSSRLRFLSQSEMVTSTSWTASFLESSVMMKVKDDHRRLYITMADAYTQPEAGLSWKRIRAMTSRGPDAPKQEPMNGIAIEACWTYNDNLDYTASNHSSFSAAYPSQKSSHGEQRLLDGDGDEGHPLSPRSSAPLPHRRTLSLPSSHSAAAPETKEITSKRRVASFETSKHEQLPSTSLGTEGLVKRRRISGSPSIERRGVNFTPRWSREPPSPFASELTAEAKSQGTSNGRKRGATPFAYATPHSNSNIIVQLDSLIGDGGDTEADTDMPAVRSEPGEDEWHGVDDDVMDVEDDADAKSGVYSGDDDSGDDSEDELTHEDAFTTYIT